MVKSLIKEINDGPYYADPWVVVKIGLKFKGKTLHIPSFSETRSPWTV
jgi:hypothetical protein